MCEKRTKQKMCGLETRNGKISIVPLNFFKTEKKKIRNTKFS